MSTPLVSVIIPVRNAEKYITQALTSILSEKEIPLEVIIIDDGSEDNSIQLVTKKSDQRVRIIKGLEQGISSALNLGIEATRGEIIMRCDADDYYPPQRIQQQYNWLSNHAEFAAICGRFSTVDSRGRLVSQLNCGTEAIEITEALQQAKTRTHLCTFAIRSSTVKKNGGFRSYFETAEDLDFKLRLSEQGRIWYTPENWYYYRLHDSSITHISASKKREFFDFTARKMQQQRQTVDKDDIQLGNPPAKPQASDIVVRKSAEHIQGHLIGRAWQEHGQNNYLRAIRIGIRAVGTKPNELSIWRSLIALILKSVKKI